MSTRLSTRLSTLPEDDLIMFRRDDGTVDGVARVPDGDDYVARYNRSVLSGMTGTVAEVVR